MKRINLLFVSILSIFFVGEIKAQTNTFPTSGNVGIGTTSPSSKLHLVGDFRHTGSLISQGSTYSSKWMQFTQHQHGNSLILGAGGLTAIGAGESSTQVMNNIGGSTETLYLSSDNGLKIVTNLQSGWGSRVNALDISNNGNIGIGTTSPVSKLHVSSGTNGDGVLRLEADTDNSTEGDNARIEILQDGGIVGAYIGYNKDWSGTGDTDNVFRIVTRRTNINDESAFVIRTVNSNSVTSSYVGIGTPNPSNKLEVNGTIRSKEVIVEATGWPDYVFKTDYHLPSLSFVENYIKEHGHLPNIPSQKEVEENGQSIGETQKLLLQKIEELTLYVIELKKENELIKQQIIKLKETTN